MYALGTGYGWIMYFPLHLQQCAETSKSHSTRVFMLHCHYFNACTARSQEAVVTQVRACVLTENFTENFVVHWVHLRIVVRQENETRRKFNRDAPKRHWSFTLQMWASVFQCTVCKKLFWPWSEMVILWVCVCTYYCAIVNKPHATLGSHSVTSLFLLWDL